MTGYQGTGQTPGPQAEPFKVDGKEDNPPLSKHTAGQSPKVEHWGAEHGLNPKFLFWGSTLAA